jgi:hypothetical protein
VAAIPPEPSGTAAMVTGGAVAIQRLDQRRRAWISGNRWVVRILGGLGVGCDRQRSYCECSGGEGGNFCSHFASRFIWMWGP